MRGPDDKTSSSRSMPRRLIRPWEYRHLHAATAARFAGGGLQLGIGLILFSFGRQAGTDAERRKCYRWAAWFLVPAALNFTGGLLDLTTARGAAWGALAQHLDALGQVPVRGRLGDPGPAPEPGGCRARSGTRPAQRRPA